jgi:23S rRNA (adenine2503-C2)-methyltransferase
MDLKRLDERLDELGQPAYRGRQVWEWASGGAPGYEAMTNLPLALRTALAADVPFSTLTAEAEQRSRDGTVKTLFRTHDGHPVEAVLMRYRDGRRSVCVSSQSGCPLTCTFCATGRMAFGRNLTASEILDQVLHFRRSEPVNHLVFMGMGEPFMNVDAVLDAARRLPDIGITHRRTTISTVGWLPGLERFVEEVTEPIRLALSLHAADPTLRRELMPVNDRYPLPDVLVLCRRHWERTNRRVFVEYVMLAGVNDSPAQARALAELLGRRPSRSTSSPTTRRVCSTGRRARRSRRSRLSSTPPACRRRFASPGGVTSLPPADSSSRPRGRRGPLSPRACERSRPCGRRPAPRPAC